MTIPVDGNAETVQWDTTTGTLPHLQQAVDSLVALHEHVTMWVNDEGLVKGMPVNIVATSIARGFGFTDQPYFGPVVFTGGGDEEGETLGLTEQHAEALTNLARLLTGCSCPSSERRRARH